MKLFSADGKNFEGLTKAGDCVILCFLAVVFSLPILTAGASITAAYSVSLKVMRDEEGYIWKSFLAAWKANMKQSIAIELIMGLVVAALCADVSFMMGLGFGTFGSIIELIAIGVLIIVGAALIYVFAILAQFDNTVGGTIRNAFLLSIHNIKSTSAMLIATYGLIYLTVLMPSAIIVTMPAILYVDSYLLNKIFVDYIEKEKEQETQEEQFA